MSKKEFQSQITGNYGVSKKASSTAIKICEQLVKTHKIPVEQIEIIEDCVVHFYLLGAERNMSHFHITVEDRKNIEYGVELIEGHNFNIEYFQSVTDTIEYLDEFVSLCLNGEIFEEFTGEYREFKRA